jgi:hypothetical protein
MSQGASFVARRAARNAVDESCPRHGLRLRVRQVAWNKALIMDGWLGKVICTGRLVQDHVLFIVAIYSNGKDCSIAIPRL